MRPIVLALVALLVGVAAGTETCAAAGGECVSSCKGQCSNLVEAKKLVFWTSKQCTEAKDKVCQDSSKTCCIACKATQDQIDEFNFFEAQKDCDKDCIRLEKLIKVPEPKCAPTGFCVDDCTSACRGIHAKLGYKYEDDKPCGAQPGSGCGNQQCCGLNTADLTMLEKPKEKVSASRDSSHSESRSSSEESSSSDSK